MAAAPPCLLVSKNSDRYHAAARTEYTLTWPLKEPFPALFRAPIATVSPFEDNETEVPE